MSKEQEIQNILITTFPKKHVGNLIKHYKNIIHEYLGGEWEECVAKGGKFTEAALKALYIHSGNTLPPARQFKVENIIQLLQNTNSNSCHDSVRITIPRACRYIYDIASNRGARHDPTEVDPNKMDATVVVPVISWILAEMIRIAGSSLDPEEAFSLVESLMERKYPYIETIEDQIFINIKGLSTKEISLLLLNAFYPKRIKRADLVRMTKDHGCREGAVRVAITRMKNIIAENENGLVLRGIGRQEADSILMTRMHDN